MAILVAAGGAALGTALGVGPAAGWLAGAALGNLLFPGQSQDSRVEARRRRPPMATASPDVTPAILGSSYTFIEHIHETDPATGETWNPAAIDAVQAGLEVAP